MIPNKQKTIHNEISNLILKEVKKLHDKNDTRGCKIKYDRNILYTIQKNYQFDNVEEFSMIVQILHMYVQHLKNDNWYYQL
mgnify:CR=1 FL=1